MLKADTVQGGQATIQHSATPQQFSATLGKVNSLTLRVIPGYCSKVYIGFSNMNLSTYAGIIKVLYPNCNGGLSDEWSSPADVTGTDSFDSSQIYIAADDGLTAILWQSNSIGAPAASLLKPTGTQGPLPDNTLFGGSGTYSLEAHIVPGMSGKVTTWLQASSTSPLKYNYPNNGTVTGNITDGWRYTATTKNGANSRFYDTAQVSGEYMLVTQWSYQ